jgi:hypothetical protein
MVLTQLQALAITLAVEGVLAVTLAHRAGAGRVRCAAAAVGGSLITHPFVWAGVLEFYPVYGPVVVRVFEAGTMAVEAAGYRLVATRCWRSAIFLSVTANLASWGLGFVLQRIL